MKATHTPGPWLANDDGLVWSDHTSLGKENVIGAFTQADAALIASAPELLAALYKIVAINGSTGGDKALVAEFKHIARAAIAKAKGGSHE